MLHVTVVISLVELGLHLCSVRLRCRMTKNTLFIPLLIFGSLAQDVLIDPCMHGYIPCHAPLQFWMDLRWKVFLLPRISSAHTHHSENTDSAD